MPNHKIEKISDILGKKNTVKAPAYQWQDLALRIISELDIPSDKRASVFKICKTQNRSFVEMSMNDTKELCKSGEKWKYFFKVIAGKGKPKA